MDRKTDRPTDGSIEKRTDGQREGQTDGTRDGRTDSRQMKTMSLKVSLWSRLAVAYVNKNLKPK